MDNLTRESVITLAEKVDQTVFEHVVPGIGLVTVSVRFTICRLFGVSNSYMPHFAVYTHIAGHEHQFECMEEYIAADAVNKAVNKITELSKNFRIVKTA